VQAYQQFARASGEGSLNALAGQADIEAGNLLSQNEALNPVSAPERSESDLVVTNRGLYLVLSEEDQHRIPISRISAVQSQANGIFVAGIPAEKFSWVFLLDDPPFASRLIGGLGQLAHG